MSGLENNIIHGKLEIIIYEARGLPDTDNMLWGLIPGDLTDPYVTVHLDSVKLVQTSTKDNTLEPSWGEKYNLEVCHRARQLRFTVRDKDHTGSEDIGEVLFSISPESGVIADGWYPLRPRPSSPAGGRLGEMRVRAELRTATRLGAEYYRRALEDLLTNQYLVDSYFPSRTQCHVDLYSCARNVPQPVTLSDGLVYQPGSCWLDLYRDLVRAEKFIYITGWSVWTHLTLLRGDDQDWLGKLTIVSQSDLQLYRAVAESRQERELRDLTLGELLVRKADDGVRVLLLVWSDISDQMGTHDNETHNFFTGTRVQCCKVPRGVSIGELSDFFNTSVAKTYTHHQKSVIVDSLPSEDGEDRRRGITAYVGGLDLTDGRYDRPEHPLFTTLHSLHAEDFYQGSAPGVTAGTGPRQPWQDIHARITGHLAYDVLKNFTERWAKQGSGRHHLYRLNEEKFNLRPETGDWNVQLLRSITDDSAVFTSEAGMHTLTTKKSRTIEDSILKAYVKLIRTAERFVYIENQYFLGSAHVWAGDQHICCHHTVPAEIAEKISEKIRDNEPFMVHVVIPLHPEGDPAAAATQEIIAWQRKTMEMMYQRVGESLRIHGRSGHPTDYLQFYCLVKTERQEDIPHHYLHTPEPGSKAELLRETRRFMIYVHSKLMIVDDSAAIVGSANINQRSLAGSRDSELAVLAHQPLQTLLTRAGQLPDGDVARFRLRIMEEHLGGQSELLTAPHSAECVRWIRETCRANWESTGHLVHYPIEVDGCGGVSNLPGLDCFPDTSAPIEGAKAWTIPAKLTT